MAPIILGSSSIFRKRVLEEAGFVFTVMAADIDEKAIRDPDPAELTLKIARAKAKALLPRIAEPAFLITSDQVDLWKNEIREKPESPDEARRWLREYHGEPVTTVTAVVVTNTANGCSRVGVDMASIVFRPISAYAIERAIERGNVLRCGGGIDNQDPDLLPYIERIHGEASSFTGLPISLTRLLLSSAGYQN